jgi:hypothetical protein
VAEDTIHLEDYHQYNYSIAYVLMNGFDCVPTNEAKDVTKHKTDATNAMPNVGFGDEIFASVLIVANIFSFLEKLRKVYIN